MSFILLFFYRKKKLNVLFLPSFVSLPFLVFVLLMLMLNFFKKRLSCIIKNSFVLSVVSSFLNLCVYHHSQTKIEIS